MIESLLSGGAVGLLGSIASNVFGYFKAEQEHKQSYELRKLDIAAAAKEHDYAMEQIKAEAQYANERLVIEGDQAVSMAEYSALEESYKQDRAYTGDSKLMLLAQFICKVTRPVLTFTLVFLTTGIYFTAEGDTKQTIAKAVVAMTATVVSWWFADRQIAKQISGKIL